MSRKEVIDAEVIKEEIKEPIHSKDFVLQFNGGIGKIISATSFVRWLKGKYPNNKITVISPWPEVFEYNPNIYRNLPAHQAYLYEDYIKGRDFRNGEPYQLQEYYREEDKMHLGKLWPKAYGFNEYNDNIQPEFFLTPGEMSDTQSLMNQGAPIFTIQINGGVPQGAPTMPNKADFAQRDFNMRFGTAIASMLLQKGFRVIQVAQQHEPKIPIPQVMQMNLPFRRFACLGPYIAGHIGIDSSMMHAMAAFNTPQLIFFQQTHKDNLGYTYEGFFPKWKKEGMFCRPHVALPDNGGIYPYRHPEEGKAMEWSMEELKEATESFIDWIINNRLQKLYPNMKIQKKEETK